MEIESVFKNSKNHLHGIGHIQSILKMSERLLKEEGLEINKQLFKTAVYWHDVGRVILGENVLTHVLDGPLSALVYLLKERRSVFNWKIFWIIWNHTRLFYFLGSKVDRFLYRPTSLEEKILWDLDLIDMINPDREGLTKNTKLLLKGLIKTVSPKHFYFGYSQKLYWQHKKVIESM